MQAKEQRKENGVQDNQEAKEKIRRRVQREFPGCKSLQDLHYYRFMKEIEWKSMSPAEVVKDIKSGANEVRKQMKATAPT